MTSELSEQQCLQEETRTKLKNAEQEVNRLKNQLQQYVKEVQRAEDLLMKKVMILYKI